MSGLNKNHDTRNKVSGEENRSVLSTEPGGTTPDFCMLVKAKIELLFQAVMRVC